MPEENLTRPSTPLGPVRTTTLYAVVDAEGNLLCGVGAVGATKLSSTGTYQVDFNVDVSLGAYNATATNNSVNNDDTTRRFAMVVPAGNSPPNSVIVKISNDSGSRKNNGFHLTVTTAYGLFDMNPG